MPSPEPHLIAHLVRGQPAFDIAIILDEVGTESDPGPWWIIPTSGHRAYPYWFYNLNQMVVEGDHPAESVVMLDEVPEPPPNWPDHYAPSAAPKGQGLISNLAERLGLIPKPPTITRR